MQVDIKKSSKPQVDSQAIEQAVRRKETNYWSYILALFTGALKSKDFIERQAAENTTAEIKKKIKELEKTV